jgi:hypothetical protein
MTTISFTEDSLELLINVRVGIDAMFFHVNEGIISDEEVIIISEALQFAFDSPDFTFDYSLDNMKEVLVSRDTNMRTLIFYLDHDGDWGFEISHNSPPEESIIEQKIESADVEHDLASNYGLFDMRNLKTKIRDISDVVSFLEKYGS